MDLDRLRRRVRLQDLETLAAVVEAGGMRKAAEALHISQPAVSRAIRDLEEKLGVQLLQRGRRGVEPTLFGEALVRRSAAVFDELQSALGELQHLADPGSGEVRLGCGEPLHGGVVGATVAALAHDHPRMRFVLESGQSADLVSHFLRQRLVDLVIARPGALPLASDLAGEPLFHDRLQVAVGRSHPLARRRRVRLADLVNEHWILSANELKHGSPLALAFRAAGLPMPERIIASGSLHTRLALLYEGSFVTLVPHSLLPFGDYRARLHVLPVAIGAWDVPTMILTLKGRTLGPAPQLFLQRLRLLAAPLAAATGSPPPRP